MTINPKVMIDHLKHATVAQIYVQDLRFYEDFTSPEAARTFCQELGITFLPSRDRVHAYQWKEEGYLKIKPTAELCCRLEERIFETDFLHKLKSGSHDEVLFVVDEGRIQGVVHITDYNCEYVYFELYKLIHRLEKGLRQALVERGESNNSFIDWVRLRAETSKNSRHWKNRLQTLIPEDHKEWEKAERKRMDCQPLQTFFFGELLDFAGRKGYLPQSIGKRWDEMNYIRNIISHSTDFARKPSSSDSGPLYNIESLDKFVRSVHTLFAAYDDVMGLLSK